MKNRALEKIETESKSEKFTKLSGKEKAVAPFVLEAIRNFINQDEEFAQAVVETDKTITDCICSAMKGVGNSISDIDVYQRAVKFYFSTATVSFVMKIDLCGDNGSNQKAKSALEISLDDLLDF